MKNNKNYRWTAILLITCTLVNFGCEEEDEGATKMVWEQEVEQAKAATMKYTDFDLAESEGFIDVSGYVPQMGHHYLLPARVDGTFELEKPEILLYVPDADGNMEFIGIEYAIQVEDANNPGTPPEGFTGSDDEWHFREDLAQWQLHVWTVKPNTDGIFAPLNPAITFN